jgi:hypothetical protein
MSGNSDLQTPCGSLSEIDLSDPLVAERLLGADKHQLIDGLVAEERFDEIIRNVVAAVAAVQTRGETSAILAPNVETVIVRRKLPNRSSEWLALVWPHQQREGLGRYLLSLQKGFRVVLIDYDPATRHFTAAEFRDGKRIAPPVPLTSLMEKLKDQQPAPVKVANAVRDPERHQAVWSYLSDRYGADLAEQVLLPRILLNWGIQPWFRAVWNVDRVLIRGEQCWVLELKHKFPRVWDREGDDPDYFGLNTGQLEVYRTLAKTGLQCLHMILVKPYRSRHIGARYLVANPEAHACTVLAATFLDEPHIRTIVSRKEKQSGSHTTYDGGSFSSQNFYGVPVTDFFELGVLSEGLRVLGARTAALINGERLPPITKERLDHLSAAAPRSPSR